MNVAFILFFVLAAPIFFYLFMRELAARQDAEQQRQLAEEIAFVAQDALNRSLLAMSEDVVLASPELEPVVKQYVSHGLESYRELSELLNQADIENNPTFARQYADAHFMRSRLEATSMSKKREHSDRAIELYKKLRKEAHESFEIEHGFARGLGIRAVARLHAGEFAQAIEDLQQAASIERQLLPRATNGGNQRCQDSIVTY